MSRHPKIEAFFETDLAFLRQYFAQVDNRFVIFKFNYYRAYLEIVAIECIIWGFAVKIVKLVVFQFSIENETFSHHILVNKPSYIHLLDACIPARHEQRRESAHIAPIVWGCEEVFHFSRLESKERKYIKGIEWMLLTQMHLTSTRLPELCEDPVDAAATVEHKKSIIVIEQQRVWIAFCSVAKHSQRDALTQLMLLTRPRRGVTVNDPTRRRTDRTAPGGTLEHIHDPE